jgi:periplasmic mercuric ion binding protein
MAFGCPIGNFAPAGGGFGRSSAISRKMSWNICRAMATSAIWKAQPWPFEIAACAPLPPCLRLATFTLEALASPALAGETTVRLAVRNWYCAACPHVIKQSLAAVPGVINVEVSDKTKTATVTFDDAKTNLKSLTQATIEAGYPSFLYTEGTARTRSTFQLFRVWDDLAYGVEK